jgi:hypothetical protein
VRSPITESDIRMTARDMLARAIGLYHPISEADREQIIDAGLADESDFEPSGHPLDSGDGPPTYSYRGSRWMVEFRAGRPHLVEDIEVPADAARSGATEAEHRFALVVDTLEAMRQRPLTDGRIAELREDGWREAYAEARRRDEGESGPEAAATELQERQQQRLGRAHEMLGAPVMLPHMTADDAIDGGDGGQIGRYLIVTLVRMHAGSAECAVDIVEDAEAVLSQVARLILEGHRLLRVCDLDADTYQDPVGVTIRLSLSDEPDIHYERGM